MSAYEQFTACPNCGKTASRFRDSDLSIYHCGCGKTYCDYCSGGGLIDLPMCPVSSYHEGKRKVGYVPARAKAAEASAHSAPIPVPSPLGRDWDFSGGTVVEWWKRAEECWTAKDRHLATRCMLEILRLDPDLDQVAWQNLTMHSRCDMRGVPQGLVAEVQKIAARAGPGAFDSPSARQRRVELVEEMRERLRLFGPDPFAAALPLPAPLPSRDDAGAKVGHARELEAIKATEARNNEMMRRREARLCIYCGKKVGILTRMLGKKIHIQCRTFHS